MIDDADGDDPITPRWGRLLELIGLSGVAIAQPVLAVFGEDPGTFVAYGIGAIGVVVFGAAVILVPPLALFAVEAVVGRLRPSSIGPIHLAFVGLLAGVCVLGWINGVGFRSPVVFYLALMPALAAVLLRARWPPMGSWLRWLVVTTPILMFSFLFIAPTSALMARGGSGDGGAVTSGPPVVVITLDELPTASLLDGAGNIDADAHPNIAGLAADGTWYRNHVTSADRTLQSVPALLTGTGPASDRSVTSQADLPGSIFTLFDQDADLVSLEWLTEVCPPRRCVGSVGPDIAEATSGLVGDVLRVFRDQHTPGDPEGGAGGDFDALLANGSHEANAERFAEVIDGSPSIPDLSFVHVALPHQPWVHLPDGRRHDLAPAAPPGGDFDSEADARLARDLHLLQVEHTDRVVGDLLDRLRDRGWYDDAVVVLTADHGVSFTPGTSSRDLSGDNAAEIAWTPLIIKYPGQRTSEVVDDLARLTDVAPTIAGVLGVEPDWEVEGRDLRTTDPPAADEPVLVWAWTLGDTVPVDPALFRSTLLAADLSGQVDDPALRVQSLHRHGPIVGRSVTEVGVGPASSATAAIEDGRVRRFDPDSPFPHVAVEGTTDLPVGSSVAVTVNGRVGVLADPAVDGEQLRFRGVLPVELLGPGDNELRVYEVVDGGGAPSLRPLSGD